MVKFNKVRAVSAVAVHTIHSLSEILEQGGIREYERVTLFPRDFE